MIFPRQKRRPEAVEGQSLVESFTGAVGSRCGSSLRAKSFLLRQAAEKHNLPSARLIVIVML